jgi:methionine-rich copper-binding protein CopC
MSSYHLLSRRLWVAAALTADLCFESRAALAHAHLDHASPAAGSTVAPAPQQVTLWFTEALEPKFSSVEVRDEKGAAVQSGAATLARDNTAQLSVPLKPLGPGTYKVIWRVLSVDTHRTQGNFTFTVGK